MGSTKRICGIVLAVVLVTAACFAAANKTTAASLQQGLLDLNASQTSAVSPSSAFMPIEQAGLEAGCTSFRAPRLVTFVATDFLPANKSLTVDVIINKEGAVDSLLVLDDPGPALEHKIADRVRRWVYRPALCNGMPVDVEGKIEIPAHSGL